MADIQKENLVEENSGSVEVDESEDRLLMSKLREFCAQPEDILADTAIFS